MLPKIRAATGTLSVCMISAVSLQSNTKKAVDGAGDFPEKRAGLIFVFWLWVAGRACTPGHWLQLRNSPMPPDRAALARTSQVPGATCCSHVQFAGFLGTRLWRKKA